MKNLLISLILVCSGCAYVPGPSYDLSKDEYDIKIKVYSSYDEISKKRGSNVYGFAEWNDKSCTIHYVHNDYETFIHELKHCYYGHWHE